MSQKNPDTCKFVLTVSGFFTRAGLNVAYFLSSCHQLSSLLSTVGAEGVLEPECLTALIIWLFKADAKCLNCSNLSSSVQQQLTSHE